MRRSTRTTSRPAIENSGRFDPTMNQPSTKQIFATPRKGCQKCSKPSVVKMRCEHLFFCLPCFKAEPYQIECKACKMSYTHPQVIYFDERDKTCACGRKTAYQEHVVPECGH